MKFQMLQIDMVKYPMDGMEIKIPSSCNVSDNVYKYDKAMKLLEIENNEISGND